MSPTDYAGRCTTCNRPDPLQGIVMALGLPLRVGMSAEDYDREEQLYHTARHEAGHAVARWLRGLPAAASWLHDAYTGHVEGTGQFIREDDALFVTLAGYSVESGYGIFGSIDIARHREQILLRSRGKFPELEGLVDDIDRAIKILEESNWLRRSSTDGTTEDVDIALKRHMAWVSESLLPHDDLIETIALRLMESRHLSARTIAALCRESGRRIDRMSRADGASRSGVTTPLSGGVMR